MGCCSSKEKEPQKVRIMKMKKTYTGIEFKKGSK